MGEPKDIESFEISQRTLYDVKRALTGGRPVMLRDRTARCFLAYVYASQ